MSRIASPSKLRSFCTRSSWSEFLRLRSARSVCSTRRLEICRLMYHESATTAASVTINPSSRPVVGDRPSAPRLSPTSPRPGGTAFPLPVDQVGGWRFSAQLAQAGGVLTAVIVAVHGALGQRFGHSDRQRRILEPHDRNGFTQPRVAQTGEERSNLVMVLARVRMQVVKRGVVLGLAHLELALAIADRPKKSVLHKM